MRHPLTIGCLLAVGVFAMASRGASGLRLLPPSPLAPEGLRVSVVSADGSPLSVDRASRIDLLHAVRPTVPPGDWLTVAGPRKLTDGVLQVDHAPSVGTAMPVSGFFLAREAALGISVTVSNAPGLRSAVAAARPGTRILLASGVYPGGFTFSNLRGQPGQPIVIGAADPANRPVLQGGANGIQLSDPEWVELENLVFTGATGNGLNIDDAGSLGSPARNVVLRGLRVTDVGPRGNRDGIKLSGVTDFRVENCLVERWGDAGSGVDMVGCHRGVIEGNTFRHSPAASATGANGVQAKGGTRDVVIRRNRFEDAGARSVNLGGSTGLEFFRPPLVSGEQHWEARDIRVEGNTFLGSTAPVAYVGSDGAIVRFNTLYRPERWVLRILQETTAPGFVPCRNGQFTDNLVVFHSTQWSAGGVNVGAGTAPATFGFARNWWYCLDAPARSRPTLPVAETGGVYGQSPQFRDAANGDFRLQPGSPAHGVGADALP